MDVPPKNSRIRVEVEKGVRKITILPSKISGLMAAFCLLLGMGFIILGNIKDQGRVKGPYGHFDFLSSSGLFLLAGIAIVIFLLSLLNTRRLFAETFLLRTSDMVYDPGSLKTVYKGYRSRKSYLAGDEKTTFTFTLRQLKTLKLTRFTGFNRLTIELDDEFYELAPDISNHERQWLYQAIKKHYSLGVR